MVAGFALLAAALCAAPGALAVTNYPADFVDPKYIIDFQYAAQTAEAQQTIVGWANQLGKKRPWSEYLNANHPPSLRPNGVVDTRGATWTLRSS